MTTFTGLSAFPLTPLREDQLDETALAALIERLAQAEVDSITVLGSTGSYAYLSDEERAAATRIAVAHAGEVPVLVGVGALRTRHVHALVEDAQDAGAAGVLLAPMTYQQHTDDDVFGLYRDVTTELSVPLIVYDNPTTTHFAFSDELYRRIAELPHVASIKIPAVPTDPQQAAARVGVLRDLLPDHVSIGISGDSAGARGLNAGCDLWYSVIAGTLPHPALDITRAALGGQGEAAADHSQRLQPLWDLFARHGSLRVTAAIAEHLGMAQRSCLPLPLRGLDAADRLQVVDVIEQLNLHRAP